MKNGGIDGTAFGMTFDEFCILDEQCGGFNDEYYRNHPIHNDSESFMTFIKKGSESLKKNPMIQRKLY